MSAPRMTEAQEGVRIKDLARITSVRSNQLLGYGLVAGLPGTGDMRSAGAREALSNLLEGMGHDPALAKGETRNIAVVTVTAEIPPFAKKGDRISVTVSSAGDARSLENGVLLRTPLYAGNGEIYAVAQGNVVTGGTRQGEKSRPRTTATIPLGGLVEKEAGSAIAGEDRNLRISLNYFDFSMLLSVQEAVKEALEFSEDSVRTEGGSLIVKIPEEMNPVQTVATIENLRVKPVHRSRVVINERTGTVIMGGEIRIDPVMISRAGFMKKEEDRGRNPATMGIYLPSLKKDEEKHQSDVRLIQAASVTELVKALHEMGATVQDIIAILEAMKDGGALHAELIVI